MVRRWPLALAALAVGACNADATTAGGAGGSGGTPNPHHALAMHPEPEMVGAGGATTGSGGLTAIVRSDRAPSCPPSSQPQLPECNGDWWISVQFADSELVPGAIYELAPDGSFRGLIHFSGVPDGQSSCTQFGGIGFSGGRVEIIAVDESNVTLTFTDSANDEGLAIPLDGTYRVAICN
jgi:hypothetical protein